VQLGNRINHWKIKVNLNVRSYINREFPSGESVLQNNTGITNKIGRDFATTTVLSESVARVPGQC
jgi:hypothetical protein